MPTVLVVGADRGIAHALSRQLNERGDTVIAACLAGNDELVAAGVRVEGGVDVTSQASVDALAAGLTAEGVKLDAVFHVAGVLGLDQLGSIDYDDVAGSWRSIRSARCVRSRPSATCSTTGRRSAS